MLVSKINSVIIRHDKALRNDYTNMSFNYYRYL